METYYHRNCDPHVRVYLNWLPSHSIHFDSVTEELTFFSRPELFRYFLL